MFNEIITKMHSKRIFDSFWTGYSLVIAFDMWCVPFCSSSLLPNIYVWLTRNNEFAKIPLFAYRNQLNRSAVLSESTERGGGPLNLDLRLCNAFGHRCIYRPQGDQERLSAENSSTHVCQHLIIPTPIVAQWSTVARGGPCITIFDLNQG